MEYKLDFRFEEESKILYHWFSTEELYILKNRLSELIHNEENKYVLVILKQQLTKVNKEYFSRKI